MSKKNQEKHLESIDPSEVGSVEDVLETSNAQPDPNESFVPEEPTKPHGQEEPALLARDQYGYPQLDSAGNILKQDGQPLTGVSDEELERLKKQKL